MNLTIKGHHIEITDAIHDYVTSKLERVIRHADNVTSVAVILTVEKLEQKAEVTLHVRGKDLFVEASDANLYTAIDSMVDKLDRLVIKHKKKNQDHNHHALKHQEAEL